MFENYVDVIEASKILDVHPETVKRLIREGKLTAAEANKRQIQLLRLPLTAEEGKGNLQDSSPQLQAL